MFLRRWLPVAVMLLLIFHPAIAQASQLITNGYFTDGLNGWRVASRLAKVKAEVAGNRGPGSVKLELMGGRLRGEASISQDIPVKLSPGSKASISFSWRKNWLGAAPAEQSAVIQIIQPDGKAVDVWSDKVASSADTWHSTTVDVANAIGKEGNYAIRLAANFENGAGAGAGNQVSFDDVSFSVPTISSEPRTTILAPTGLTTLSGSNQVVAGVTNDDATVSKVELAFRREGDGYYWNGNSWSLSESWVPAKIITGQGTKGATWSYNWPLPTSDGEKFKLLASAEDAAGNREWSRSIDLKVDTVAPTGAIYINDAASYTRSRQVKIDNQVTGASQMRFSIDGGLSWSKWRQFAQSVEMELPAGDGSKVVTGEFRDDVGNTFKVSDNIALDTTPPVTRMTFPPPGASKVKPSSTIGAVFYEEMNGATFKNDGTESGSTFYVKQGSAWMPGSVIYDDGTRTAKFIPASPLAEGTMYTAYLTGVEDAAGNRLAANYSWSFTTAGSSKLSLSSVITKASGGKISDGSGLIELTIPPEAVGFDVTVSLTEVKEEEAPKTTGLTRFSGVYKLGPDSIKLLKQALLRVKYQPVEGVDESIIRVFVYDKEAQQWTVAPSRLDVTANTASTSADKAILFTVAARADSEPPTTTILNPTGSTVLSGKTQAIVGAATDDFSVSRVEVAIVRLKDGFYWNGNSWSASESWVAARIINGRGTKSASWSYNWPLPIADGRNYRILARSIDGGGNREQNPAAAYVEMAGK
ncbi:MAG: Ig-like domain-containing protein [Actinobacteria bacterium]|nr:Ig-like domain-containing protein [Actinomycetota bacterium]